MDIFLYDSPIAHEPLYDVWLPCGSEISGADPTAPRLVYALQSLSDPIGATYGPHLGHNIPTNCMMHPDREREGYRT